MWVRDPKVIEPDHKTQFCGRESEHGLIVFVGPIIDGMTPWVGPKAAIKNRTGVLVGRVQVHHRPLVE